MPNLIKIGYTTRDINERIFELSSSTGVPENFKLEYKYFSNSPFKLEQRIHRCLNSYRASQNREFFLCTSTEAIEIIKAKIDIIPDRNPDDEPLLSVHHPNKDYKEKFYSSLYPEIKKPEEVTQELKNIPPPKSENWVIKCSYCNYNNVEKFRPNVHEQYFCSKCRLLIF